MSLTEAPNPSYTEKRSIEGLTGKRSAGQKIERNTPSVNKKKIEKG